MRAMSSERGIPEGDDRRGRPDHDPEGGNTATRRIAAALRTRDLPPDEVFDRYLPEALQGVSSQHWSMLRIAVQVARWVNEHRIADVLDIGSGAGKFCVAAALASDARYLGIEHRPRLVEAARALAHTFGVDDRVTFIEGDAAEIVLPDAEAYYVYNPFGENLVGPEEWVDDEVEHSRGRFERDRATLEAFFDTRPPGTYVFTYNGFGGTLPANYREMRCDRTTFSVLRMLRKTARPGSSTARPRRPRRT